MAEDNCSSYVPTSDVYLSQLSVGYIVAISMCSVVTLVVCLLYFEQIYFFFKHLGTWKPKDKAVWLIGIYPTFCLTSLVALLVPRSALLDNLVAALYLSICVYLFVGMLIGHYGGARKMSRKLAHFPIHLRTPPCCCCCLCIPESLPMTTFRLQVLELLVLQYALLKPITSYIAAILAADDKYFTEDLSLASPYLWISIIDVTSTLIAIYGFLLVYNVSRIPLQKMCVKPKFICLQLVLIISNFQHLIVAIFVKTGVVPCDPPLSAKSNGERWHHMFVIVEMLCISIAARNYYRRHVGDTPDDIEAITTDTVTTGNHTMTTDSNNYGATSQEVASSFQNGVLVLQDNDSTADVSEITLSVSKQMALHGPDDDVTVGLDNPLYQRSPSVSAMAGSLDISSQDGSTSEEKVSVEVTEDASEI